MILWRHNRPWDSDADAFDVTIVDALDDHGREVANPFLDGADITDSFAPDDLAEWADSVEPYSFLEAVGEYYGIQARTLSRQYNPQPGDQLGMWGGVA